MYILILISFLFDLFIYVEYASSFVSLLSSDVDDVGWRVGEGRGRKKGGKHSYNEYV